MKPLRPQMETSTRSKPIRDDHRQELDTMRQVIDEELYESQEEILDYINETAPYLGGLSDEHTRLNLSPDMFQWKFVELRTSELLRIRPASDWRSWYKNERLARADDDGDDSYFDSLEQEWSAGSIGPIIAVHLDGSIDIADGWHRAAIAITKGWETVPVVVGRLKRAVVSESRISRGSLWTIDYRALWPDGRGVWRVAIVRAMSAAEALAKLRARERERLTNVTIKPGHNVPGYPTSAIIHEASHELLRESVNGTWYHGSPTRFERFHRRVAPTFGTGASEVPIFLTQDIDFAQLHAGPSGFIYTVRPHVKRTFDATTFVLDEKYWPPPRDALNSDGQAFYDDLVDNRIFPELIRYGTKHEEEDEWDTMHDSNGTYASILARQYDVMETTEMKRWMLVHDYDSFFVRGDGPKNNLAVFDPSKVEILSTDPSK